MNRSPDEVVKSAARVFKILELFESRRCPLTATDIGKSLGYPPSSTLALLKSMASLGYLSFDCLEFTYCPTLRLPLVGQWIKAAHVAGDMCAVMRQIHEATGEAVSLCAESDGHMQVLALAPSDDLASFSPVTAVGDRAPLFNSVIGLTALSRRSDDDAVNVAAQLLRRPRYIRPDIDIAKSLSRIRSFRGSGFGIAYDVSVPNVGAMAWPVTPSDGGAPLMLGVWGPSARIKAKESFLLDRVNTALQAQGAATY